MQADTREIRGQQVCLSGIISMGRQIREKNLRTLVFVFLLLKIFPNFESFVECFQESYYGQKIVLVYVYTEEKEQKHKLIELFKKN